jgi:hypothetical protein
MLKRRTTRVREKRGKVKVGLVGVTTMAMMTPVNSNEEPTRSSIPSFSSKIHQAIMALNMMTTELMGEQIDRGA